MKTQIEIKRHDGTKFRVTLDKRESEYVVEYRNDKTGVVSYFSLIKLS